MRAAGQERSQERLPPKKRDLPAAAAAAAAHGDEEAVTAAVRGGCVERAAGRSGESPVGVPAEWGCLGGGGAEAGGLAVDPYGLLYKVSAVVPRGVVSVSPLPPAAFSVAAPLLQHPGATAAALPYSPVHYAQLPPGPLHFVGSHYSPVPYAQLPPQGFLPPGHLLPTSPAGLAASRIPHFLPYTPLLLEEAVPPAAESFAKAAPPLPTPGHGQQPQQPPLDARQGRFPVHYQLPAAGYSSFGAPDQNMNRLLQDPPLTITTNGVEGPLTGPKLNKVPDVEGGGHAAVGQQARRTGAPDADRHFSVGCQLGRAEASMMTSQRSSPDTDLEVQRVVGVFASQDDSACSGQQKGSLSPLNLSHRDLSEEGPGTNPGQAAAAAKSHSPWQPAQAPQKPQLHHEEALSSLTMANGETISGSLLPATPDGLRRISPEMLTQGGPPDADRAHSLGHVPSHFMKGAIIQLATGELKRVEDLQTQDFVRSAEVSGGLKIDSSTVVDIQESPWQGFVTLHFVVGEQQSKVSIDVPPEHPFFVYGQGWSSCSPERTARFFALPCYRLQVSDVCISISLQSLNGRLAAPASPQEDTERLPRASQGLQEPQARGESPGQKGGLTLAYSPEHSHLEPTSQQGWAGPSFQRLGEEPQLPLIRPSFIPQEVKLSIEGRSNSGK